jgi:YD repeat-containing protein
MLYSYDSATLQLTQTRIQRESTSWANDTSTSYGYDPAGNVTSAADSVTGNNQCFQYDYLARLTAAWAQGSATCPGTPPGASGLGGPAPYQQTLSYDTLGTSQVTTGNITDSTLITGSGSSATTTDTSYSYPAAGASRPHAAAGYTTTMGGTGVGTTQTWTAPGQLATSVTGGTTTAYSWNGGGAAPDQLFSVTAGSKRATYRYDASGNLTVVQDTSGGTTTSTLYLPGEELTAVGSTVTGTRYYALGGQTIAARTPAGVTWLMADPQAGWIGRRQGPSGMRRQGTSRTAQSVMCMYSRMQLELE